LGRRDAPLFPTWRTLTNHVAQLASIDFFMVPTASVRTQFVFVVLSHERRRIIHASVTATRQRCGPISSSARHRTPDAIRHHM
jgi:hypothetical protein